MIAFSCSLLILLIGFICLIAARFTVGGKLGSPEAEHKGLQLLLENLSPEQSRQYDRFGYFDVLGSRTGKRYRICHGTSRNVNELVEENRVGGGRCFLPSGNLVAGDCMLAQKIMLENCEEEVLRVALRF
jgi:hypothetical protein